MPEDTVITLGKISVGTLNDLNWNVNAALLFGGLIEPRGGGLKQVNFTQFSNKQVISTEDPLFNSVSVFSPHCTREAMHEGFNGIWGTASLWMYSPGAGLQLRAHLPPSSPCVILALAAQPALQFISMSFRFFYSHVLATHSKIIIPRAGIYSPTNHLEPCFLILRLKIN